MQHALLALPLLVPALQGSVEPQITRAEIEAHVRFLASDELEGRRVFTEGYGLAAAYVADHLKEFGVTPLGDNGSYFQSVKRVGYRVTNNSSISSRS